MKALDTNILVRFLVRDDSNQSKIVYDLFKKTELEKTELYISPLVILELLWVLNSVYEIKRNDILESLNQLTLMSILQFDNLSIINKFIQEAQKSNQDLSDLLIAVASNAAGCEKVLTFDKKASKHNLFELI